MGPFSSDIRRLLLAAASLLKSLGHSGFDRFLLEIGVPEEIGSGRGLLDRTTSLARYSINTPDVVTPGGEKLFDIIISRGEEIFNSHNIHNITEKDRFEFEQARQAFEMDNKILESEKLEKNIPRFREIFNATDIPHYGIERKPVELSKETTRTPNLLVSRKIFIVHGHDEGSKEGVARFLQNVGFEPIILHERPNMGRTIITKFHEEASDVSYAVVLVTPDDTGGVNSDSLRPRARQNVVFELGYFIGKLGFGKVAALVKGDVETPSDVDGVVYIPFDNAGGWKNQLARELKGAGYEIDGNLLLNM